MEQKGLIVRTPVTYDKRIKKITLTDKAHKICEENYKFHKLKRHMHYHALDR